MRPEGDEDVIRNMLRAQRALTDQSGGGALQLREKKKKWNEVTLRPRMPRAEFVSLCFFCVFARIKGTVALL